LREIGQKGKSEVGDDEYAEGGQIGGLTADEAIYLYVKKALVQKAREKYLKPAGLWNTPKMKEVEQSLVKKGYLNGAGAINETGKNKAREVDASVDRFISREYISSQNLSAKYKELLEKFQGNDKMAEGGYMAKGGTIAIEKKGDKKVATIIHDGNVFFVEYYIDNPELKHIKGDDANTYFGVVDNKYSYGKSDKEYIAVTKKLVNAIKNNKVAYYEEGGKMANGGEVKFADKVKSIKKSLLERKKVSPKVQKDYGKTYSPKEAEESAKRIVGAMRKKMMGESK